VFHYYLTHEASREVAAFTVDGAYLKEGSHLGCRSWISNPSSGAFRRATSNMLIAVSFKQVNKARQRKADEAAAKDMSLRIT